MGAAADACGGDAVEQSPIVGKAFAEIGIEVDGSGLDNRTAVSESLIAPGLEFLGVDRLKLDPVARADREILRRRGRRSGAGFDPAGASRRATRGGRCPSGGRRSRPSRLGTFSLGSSRRGRPQRAGGDNRRTGSLAGSRWQRRRTRPMCAARRARRDRDSNERPPRRGPAHHSKPVLPEFFPREAGPSPGSMVPSSRSSSSRLVRSGSAKTAAER